MKKHIDYESYSRYLNDYRWVEFRKKIIERDNFNCTVCGKEKHLQVHHKQYHFSKIARDFIKPWEYSENLLTTLCKECHDYGHSKFKVPTKYI